MSNNLKQRKARKQAVASKKKPLEPNQRRNVLQGLGISDGTIIDNIDDGVYVLNDKGYFVYVNKVIEKRSGIPGRDFVRLHFLDIVTPNDHERVQSNFEKVMRGEQVPPYELEYMRPDGSPLAVEVNTRPIFKGDRVAALLGISRDIGWRKEAEKRLRESEERLRFLSEAVFEAVAVHHDGILIEGNEQYFKMFGYEPEELLETQMIPLTIAPESRSLVKRQVRAGGRTPYEATGQKKDGTAFPIEIWARKMDYRGREVRVAVIRDLTRRKGAEEALRQSEARLRTAMESLPFDFFVMNEDGRYIMQNQTCREHWGEIVGKRPEDLKVTEDTLRLWQRNNRRAFAGETVKEEVKFQTGEDEGYHYNIISPIHADGQIRGILGINIDITERKKAEEALRESEVRYRTVVEDQTELICRFSKDGFLTFVNGAYSRYFEKSSQELIGQNFMQLVPEEDHAKFKKLLRATGPEKPTVTHEHRVIAPDGEIRWQKWSNRAIFDEEGRFVEYQAVGRDITDRKLAEEALRKARDELEKRVAERTVELSSANKELREEIVERSRAEEAVREREAALEMKTKELEEVNSALRVLLRRRDKDKTELEEKVLSNVKELVQPYIEKLKKAPLDGKQMTYVKILESNLNDIVSPFVHQLSSKYSILTPTEIQVAQLIKEGKTTKEIAELLGSSKRTVESHRENIRVKLGLKNQKVNLRSFLSSM